MARIANAAVLVERMKVKPSMEENQLANHEIVTLAVYLLGGSARSVDTEDIAIKANEIAPGRFTWHKYKDQISLDAVRKRLWDAKSDEKGYRYLTGSERDGWMLTTEGLRFSETQSEHIGNSDLSRERLSEVDRRWRTRERERLLTSAAFLKFQNDDIDAITQADAASFFRLDEYVTGPSRERKITRIVNAFFDDGDLGPLMNLLIEKVREVESNAN